MNSTTGQLLQWLGLFSIVTFIGSLLAVPWIILRMSPDFFVRHRFEVMERHRRHPVLTAILFCLRNGLGLLLLAAGMAMLILPGQGILTLLIGLSIMNFPGKHQLLEKCVQLNTIQQSLNWIRRKGNKEDFIFTTTETG